MGQRDYSQCVGIKVRYLNFQKYIGNHYSDNMQTTKVLPSVSTKVITGRSVSHLVCLGICKCVGLKFCA